MRDPSKRLEILEGFVEECLEGISSLPNKPGKKELLQVAVAKTKYIGVATTAIKEAGTIKRKELKGDADDLRKKIKGASTIKELQAIITEMKIDDKRTGKPLTA